MAVLFSPLAAIAAEPVSIAIDAPTQQKKFIPLDSARSESKQHGITIVKEKKPIPLRRDANNTSMLRDSEQRLNGGMRLDRRLTTPTGTGRALAKPAVAATAAPAAPKAPAEPSVELASVIPNANPGALERESEEIEGNTETANPVLALFGASDVTPSSFRDAMSGRATGAMAGLIRQSGWPIPLSATQYLSSGYGMRTDPFHGRPTFHGGIDIAAATGTPVLATADADVLQVTQDKNYGKYVTLQHNDGMLSRYGHLESQSVRVGDRVKAGQVIGTVGSTGRSTGAHLDYRVSKNGMKFDPLTVLSVPASVPVRAGSPVALAVAVRRGTTVASNATPKRPMVIQVR